MAALLSMAFQSASMRKWSGVASLMRRMVSRTSHQGRVLILMQLYPSPTAVCASTAYFSGDMSWSQKEIAAQSRHLPPSSR